MSTLAEPFNAALSFALEYHFDQTRKATAVPYITHPVAVAEALAYYYPERHDLIIAGLLHDVVEDTDATFALLEDHFGRTVRRLVEAVTKLEDAEIADLPDDPLEAWRIKRQGMLGKLETTDADILRLKAADALANLRSLGRDLQNPHVGERVWTRFKAGREDSLWYYREVLARVRQGIEGEGLVGELEEVLALVGKSDA